MLEAYESISPNRMDRYIARERLYRDRQSGGAAPVLNRVGPFGPP